MLKAFRLLAICYVCFQDSADVWAHPELLPLMLLDIQSFFRPALTADAFSQDGGCGVINVLAGSLKARLPLVDW